ncbi:MAG: acetate--CoA ligase family protein [Acidimicrobiia bacterium]|nr:acetate--CoA ligase family protein [Acidimicrobiia bacterium]
MGQGLEHGHGLKDGQGLTLGDLAPLLEARSIAVIGASPKLGSVGHQVLVQLERGGFTGSILAINPNYPDMLPTLDQPVDLAVLAIANRHLESQVEVALAAGTRSFLIFASCYGIASNGDPLQVWLSRRLEGIPVCGGNGMGFLNLTRSVWVCGFHQPPDLQRGRVAFISHSGSLFSAMLHNHRHQTFNLVVSAGNELTLTQADYANYALDQEETRVIAMFTEAVRDREALSRVWTRANDRDVPVIVLKTGRNEAGAASVATHSAGLAGAYAPFVAFASAHGVHLVETMDEMMDTIALFDSKHRPTTRALGTVHDSGGEKTHLIDLAGELGIELAAVGPPTADRLLAVLDDGLEPANPVDAWGTGRASPEVMGECLGALADDPAVGAVAFAVDLTTEEHSATDYADIALKAAAATEKPLFVLSHLSSAVDPVQARTLARAEVPLLRGTATGLRAVAHLLDHRRVTKSAPPVPPATLDRWRLRLSQGILNDVEALELLSDFGIPIERLHRVPNMSKAVELAGKIGYPVAVKAVGLIHKTEHNGVRTNLRNAESLSAAWRALRTLELPLAIQRMVPGGIEIALGMVNDPQVGPVMLVGTGGVLVELLRDRVLIVPPIDHAAAKTALGQLMVGPILAGYRGTDPLATDGLVEALVAFSGLVHHLGDQLQSVDVNPLVVHSTGLAAVDALVF